MYTNLAYLHLATVVPAFLIGTYLLFAHKGTPRHKMVGKLYMLLMLITALISLGMSASVGPTVFGHFGILHLFSLLVLSLVPSAYIAAQNGNIRRHKRNMIGLYVGGILIAGVFAFMPGRMLYTWIFLDG